MRLSGSQYQLLVLAVLDAFPTRQRLAEMVRYQLGRQLDRLALGDDLEEIVFKLLRTAEAEGWLPEFVLGAVQSNPGNANLVEFAQGLGLMSLKNSTGLPEKIIRG